MINNVVLVGRITKNIELKYSANNVAYTYFTVAVNRVAKGTDGKQEADFISCVAFNKQAQNMERFVGRGSLVGVVGHIQTRTTQGKNGNTIYITEVVVDRVQFLESKKQTQNNTNNNQNFGFSNNNNQRNNNSNQRGNNQNNFNNFGNDFMSDFDFDNVVNPFNEQ